MTIVLAVILVWPFAALPQSRSGPDDERERAFVEALRREDPAAAERFIELRDAREKALADLQRVETQYNAAGAALRPVFLGTLRQARRKYAERSLAMLDFLDERDRRAVTRYQEEIGRINGVLEERKKTRAEFEKALTGP